MVSANVLQIFPLNPQLNFLTKYVSQTLDQILGNFFGPKFCMTLNKIVVSNLDFYIFDQIQTIF